MVNDVGTFMDAAAATSNKHGVDVDDESVESS